MGCARVIWNAKCDDERYMTFFARRFCPIGTYAPIDQTYSQYKNDELTPWLKGCPSQILRNSAVNWYDTYWKFIKGECGKPKRKHKSDTGSIHLTRELFEFQHCADGNIRLFIGTKRNNIGYLSFKKHRDFKAPNSIYIKRRNGVYSVSFCYGEKSQDTLAFNKDNLAHLKDCSKDWLDKYTVGVDRGVARPVQAGDKDYDLTSGQKKNKRGHEKYLKRIQQQLARRKKGSAHYKRSKQRLARRHAKITNIRKDFCHQTSRAIVNDANHKIIVLEDLNTQGMTKRAKAKPNENGGWDKNNAKAKSGLNRSILDKGWHQFEVYLGYKAQQAGKACFKVSAHHTSQACAVCGHTHPSNRKTQSEFACTSCGHTDHADHNAAMVIKQRAINLIKDSGTELSKRGVLTLVQDTGRGAKCKPTISSGNTAIGCDPSKKKRKAAILTMVA